MNAELTVCDITRDDGRFQAELIDQQTGDSLACVYWFASELAAVEAASAWCADHGRLLAGIGLDSSARGVSR